MIEKNLVVGPFQCNCRLLVCPKTGEGALIDPGDEPARILTEIAKLELPGGLKPRIKYLLHTHAHLDHIGGTRGVSEGLQAGPAQPPKPVIALHQADDPIYRNLKMQGQLFGLSFDDPLPVDHYLEHEEELRIGELRLSVVHTPGHSPGSVCLRLHEDSGAGARETLFSGDTLFQGSVGRTDLWGASESEMFRSIRTRILTLDPDTRVCPGHGPDTTVGIEKTQNPFLTA